MLPSSLLTLVRFTVAESTLHALLSGNPERRRALRAVTWGSRDTEGGEVLVTPPLRAEQAAELRTVFAGAEGVTEVDATGEYTFGTTSAPESYDGFGTLSLGEEPDGRLVAIRMEHLNWQAGRYASGLHRFRPTSPAPATAETSAPEASVPNPEATAPPPPLGLDSVVHFRGRTRRYVIVRAKPLGEVLRFTMIALSGAVKGCHPIGVSLEEVERDADQTVSFSGAAATALRRKYEEARPSRGGSALPIAS